MCMHATYIHNMHANTRTCMLYACAHGYIQTYIFNMRVNTAAASTANARGAGYAGTCSAGNACMDSDLVTLLRKHELDDAIAPLIANNVSSLLTLEQLAACERQRASYALSVLWSPCNGVDAMVPKETGGKLKNKLPRLVAALCELHRHKTWIPYMKTSTHDLDAETEAFAKKVKGLFLQDLDHSSRQSRWNSVMAMILHDHLDESSPRENSWLPVLDLSGNELEDAEAEKLADALKENANALVPMRWYIKLQDNQIGDAGAAALAAALKQKVSVQSLYLQYNRIGDAGTAALADALKVARQIGEDGGVSPETRGGAPMVLKANASLQVLHLGNNKIGDAGVAALAAALKGDASVRELILWGNRIGDTAVEALAAALKENGSLQGLYLGSNLISCRGAEALAAALKENSSLQELGLWGNQIGDTGAKALAAALKENGSLQKLELGNNQIGVAGLEELTAALKENAALQKLGILNNDVGECFSDEVREQIKRADFNRIVV